jgi:hypothetical protein
MLKLLAISGLQLEIITLFVRKSPCKEYINVTLIFVSCFPGGVIEGHDVQIFVKTRNFLFFLTFKA